MQFSIVSYLDPDATKNVRELQQVLSEVTGSKASLYSWLPHVTLGDGVEVTDSELDSLINEIRGITKLANSFSINISSFSSLESRPIGIGEISTPYAIFINIAVNPELNNIVENINQVTNRYSIWYRMPQPYLPHITLAFRDLTESGYRDGLSYLGDMNVDFVSTVDHIALVEKKPDKDIEFMRIQLS